MINFYVVGFGRPDLLREQKRLFDKYLKDSFDICLIDNSNEQDSLKMQEVCQELKLGYLHAPSEQSLHNEALNFAAQVAHTIQAEYWMTLDHDVFARSRMKLIDKIQVAGFYGIGQFHHPTKSRYLWPGFCGFSRDWLDGRIPNFDGIRGVDKRDDGDCGSMLASLFSEEDWKRMPRSEHGYKVIRPEDDFGLQSYGIEFFDSVIHLTNASNWMEIPSPDERNEILMKILREL